MTVRRTKAKATRVPDWRDWLSDRKLCASSLSFFERHHVITTLEREAAKDNLQGHLRKAYHNLDLANRLFEMHGKGEFKFTTGSSRSATMPYTKQHWQRLRR